MYLPFVAPEEVTDSDIKMVEILLSICNLCNIAFFKFFGASQNLIVCGISWWNMYNYCKSLPYSTPFCLLIVRVKYISNNVPTLENVANARRTFLGSSSHE